MSIGNMMAFLAYVMQILIAVIMASFMSVMIPRAAASADRIQQVLDTPTSVNDPEPPVATRPARLHRVQRREFRYPGAEAPVLGDISFSRGRAR